jgi:NUC153 domain
LTTTAGKVPASHFTYILTRFFLSGTNHWMTQISIIKALTLSPMYATPHLNVTTALIRTSILQALRHSKVKLTWDEDDPERNQITRRTLTKQEIEQADFKAYLASSTSGSESESGGPDSQKSNVRRKGKDAKGASRDKLRGLLLRGDDDDLPEGWGRDEKDEARDVDMEITFTPGLSQANDKGKGETTLEKYERKLKEKRKRKKEVLKERVVEKQQDTTGRIDDFFDAPSEVEEQNHTVERTRKDKVNTRGGDWAASLNPTRHESLAEELALLVASDNPNAEPKHFNMKSVLKAEKKATRKGKKGKRKGDVDDNETQEGFVLDVNDDRFKAVHEDHAFAIDPSNPQYAVIYLMRLVELI